MTESRATRLAGRPPVGLVILLGALTAYAPLALNLYLPGLPAIAADLSAMPAQMQATVSACLAGLAIGQLFYGPASDRFGRRPPLLVGGIVYIAASIACALAVSADMLIAARFAVGLGGCAGSVVARAVVRDRFGHAETARVLSLMVLVIGIAPSIGPLLGGVLLGLGGWRLNFWLLAVLGLAVTTAAWFWLAESRTEETAARARSESPLRAYLALLRHRQVLGYGLTLALSASTFFTFVAAAPSLLIDAYGLSTAQFGWLFGVNVLGIVAGSEINRQLLKRYRSDEVLAKGAWVSLGLAVLLVLAAATGIGGKWLLLGVLFLLLSTYSFTASNSMAGALNADPHRSGSISALVGALQFAIGALTATLGGLFYDGTARPMALTMLITMAAALLSFRALALPRGDAKGG